jgi:hypothetical protein
MNERPILFSAPMVRAILAGTKTQTRRVVKDPEYYSCLTGDCPHWDRALCAAAFATDCPYGAPGERLWVRENGWQRPERTPRMMREGADTWKPYYFDADITAQDHEQFKEWAFKRRPSIHMPRRFCRLVLEVTGVRVERLQDVTEEDARAEGAEPIAAGQDAAGILKTHRTGFVRLWQTINGTWLENPWVWVISFRRFTELKAAA